MTFFTLVSPGTYNVKQYGALGDGTTDDTVAITAAMNAAVAAGGGTVFFPPGNYITGPQTLVNNVFFLGANVDTCIITLKASSNADLFSANTSSINIAASYATGSNTGVNNWGFCNLTLDGNNAQQSSGPSWCIRAYGYHFWLDTVVMINAYSGCWMQDWNGSTTDFLTQEIASQVMNVTAMHSAGIGICFSGPHDTQFVNLFSGFHTTHSLQIAPNAASSQFTNVHVWAPTFGIPLLVEGSDFVFANVIAEGASSNPEVVLLGTQMDWSGGRIFSVSGAGATGIQIGQQAGNTPYTNQVYQSAGVTTAQTTSSCCIKTRIEECTGTHGALWLANDGGNTILADINQDAGSYQTGTASNASLLILNGHGLTADGTLAKTPGMQRLPSKGFNGFTLGTPTTDQVNLDSQDGVLQLPNGVALAMYSDNYSTPTLVLKNGTINLAQSSSAPDPGASGTITTTGVGIARVNPSGGSRTGCILQAGIQNGQAVIVNNESTSNSVTFAASGTSHVAQGTSVVIAANGQRVFVWTGSLWY